MKRGAISKEWPPGAGLTYFERTEKLTLRRDGSGNYSVEASDGFEFYFGGSGNYRRLALMQDALGNRISLQYSSTGHLNQITDSGGRIFTFHHDQEGLQHVLPKPASELVQNGILRVVSQP